VLLIHLIKQKAEQRTSNSWRRSINFSIRGIRKANKRRNAGGDYLRHIELEEAITESFQYALVDAAEEAFGGAYPAKVLAEMIDAEAIKKEALDLILNYEL
jgi:hypothetical protein